MASAPAERRPDLPPGSAAGSSPGSRGGHAPEPVDLSQESVAGEEDPGAALDFPMAPGKDDAGRSADAPAGAREGPAASERPDRRRDRSR